jgi:hypothetical protein
MPVTTTYQFRGDEIRRAIRRINPSRFPLLCVIPVLFTASLVLGLLGGDHATTVWGALGLAASGWIFLRYRKAVAITVSRLTEPVSVVLGDDGYGARTPTMAQTIDWSQFVRVKTTSEFWLLYLSKRNAIVLPKRAFTPEQHVAVEELLRRHPRPNTPTAPTKA